MKRIAYLAGAAVFALAASSAFAGGYDDSITPPPSQNGWYLGALIGPSIIAGSGSDAFNTAYNVGGQVGYRFDNIRLEAEASYLSHNVADFPANLDIFTLMANGYYDFNFGSKFVPYVGAGLGWLRSSLDVAGFDIGNDNEFAYQGIIGANYMFTNNFGAGVNYHIVGWTNNSGLYENRINATFNYYFS